MIDISKNNTDLHKRLGNMGGLVGDVIINYMNKSGTPNTDEVMKKLQQEVYNHLSDKFTTEEIVSLLTDVLANTMIKDLARAILIRKFLS